MYEEFRDLIRHGVASSIFRVTVQRQPPPDAGLSQALAAGAAAVRGSRRRERGGHRGHAGATTATLAAARRPRQRRPGSAIVRGALPAAPARATSANQLGDEPVAAGARQAEGGERRRPRRATRRPVRASGATIRAGAGRAPSTRSATAAERSTVGARPRSSGRRRGIAAPSAIVAYTTYRIWEQGSGMSAPGRCDRRHGRRSVRRTPVTGVRRPGSITPSTLFEEGVADRLIVTGGKAEGDRTTEAASGPGLRHRPRRPGLGHPRRGRGAGPPSNRFAGWRT